MSERPTTETDAAEYLISVGRKNDEWFVRSDVSRKLERERDEVRKELEEYRSIAEKIGAKKAVSEKEKAIRERDEAREVLQRIADADWKSAGELRGIAREALEAAK